LLRDMATPARHQPRRIRHPGASDAATMRTDTVRDDTRRPNEVASVPRGACFAST
jgi:hypothetical protein